MADDPLLTARRLHERMLDVGIDQDELAECAKVRQSTISNILTGRTRESRKLPAIANVLAVNLDWLIGNTDYKIEMLDEDSELISEEEYRRRLAEASAVNTPSRPFFSEPAQAMDGLGLVPIREVDIAFGMGGTYLDSGPVQETVVHFPMAWIRQFTDADPSMLVFARGDGDSMSPTINDRDIVLIDQRHRDINRQDRIWAIAYGEIGMIKRVRAMPDGSYKIMSDNAAVEAEIAVDGEMHVIGRVVATIRGL